MADQSGPKKETVRIAVAPPPATNPAQPQGSDTVRIELPPRQSPGTPASAIDAPQPPVFRPPPSPVQPPAAPSIGSTPAPPPNLPPPPVIPASDPPTATLPAGSGIYPSSSARAHPKQETARVSAVPDAPMPAAPTINMKKTQPLIKAPLAEVRNAPLMVSTPQAGAPIESIPRVLLWALLGVSLLVFLIQLWNYFTV